MNNGGVAYRELTLRDYFAVQSLVLFSSFESRSATARGAQRLNSTEPAIVATAAYELADAMLKERSKP